MKSRIYPLLLALSALIVAVMFAAGIAESASLGCDYNSNGDACDIGDIVKVVLCNVGDITGDSSFDLNQNGSNCDIGDIIKVVNCNNQDITCPVSGTTVVVCESPDVDSPVIGSLYDTYRGQDFSSIDQHALDSTSSDEQSISSLAAYLTGPAQSDVEKVRAIYRWVTENIAYDTDSYFSGGYGAVEAEDVLESRSSVCEGYSRLFRSLACASGLETVQVAGFAKGYSYTIGDTVGSSNHAWNAVRIGGGWYLIDSTWGAGYLSGTQFVKSFNEFYFLAAPDELIYSHLPEYSKWQLLETPFTTTQFENFPKFYSEFFEYGLGLYSHENGTVNADGNVTISFTAPTGIALMARLYQNDTELDPSYSQTQRNGGLYEVNLSFPSAGTYRLIVFADNDGDMHYEGVAEYAVVASSVSRVAAGLISEGDEEYIYGGIGNKLSHGHVSGMRGISPYAIINK